MKTKELIKLLLEVENLNSDIKVSVYVPDDDTTHFCDNIEQIKDDGGIVWIRNYK